MNWLNKERAISLGGIIIASIIIFFYINLIQTVWDFFTLTTYTGLPLAADFANYWSASKLALSGNAELVYDIEKLHNIQLLFLGSTHFYGSGWYYPPTFLLMVLPLGFIPYLVSFSLWIGITLLLFMFVLYHIKPSPLCLIFLFLFPGIFENFLFGQNGYLSGILLGGGLLLLNRSPLVAGIFFGLLSYKPNFLPLILFALIIGRYWKALMGAFLAVALSFIVTVMIFGYEIWVGYFNIMKVPLELLEKGQAPWSIMPTFFAATLSAGFDVRTAYLVQSAVMLLVVMSITWAWRKDYNLALRGSILILGVLLFTPYIFVYDLAILALPLYWLWQEGRDYGRLPGELLLLFLGWIMPIAGPLFWSILNIYQGKFQIGPVILLGLFVLSLGKLKLAQGEKSTRFNLKQGFIIH